MKTPLGVSIPYHAPWAGLLAWLPVQLPPEAGLQEAEGNAEKLGDLAPFHTGDPYGVPNSWIVWGLGSELTHENFLSLLSK